ncbi:hypothetical protein ATI53_102752 [Salipiger aestuarii]|uniref:Uncharacterized protein n=1 Tax=Salipiger aestuarii TaxID=568098 RepID=A0A327Y3H0_9RHOB|nr:hypothetical protein ATI53_102752 [Salipiger aestuarii]
MRQGGRAGSHATGYARPSPRTEGRCPQRLTGDSAEYSPPDRAAALRPVFILPEKLPPEASGSPTREPGGQMCQGASLSGASGSSRPTPLKMNLNGSTQTKPSTT